MNMFNAAPAGELKNELLHQINVLEASRALAERRFSAIAKMVLPNRQFTLSSAVRTAPISDRATLRSMVEGVQAACGRFTDSTRIYANLLNHLTRLGVPAEVVVKAAEQVCSA